MVSLAEQILTIINRYDALGMNEPDPNTVCHGQCEGTGYVPVKRNHANPMFRKLWSQEEVKNPSEDGWHLVECPECLGMGVDINEPAALVKSFAKRTKKPVKRIEHLWKKAKRIVKKQYPDRKGSEFYRLVTGIVKRMSGLGSEPVGS